MQRTLTGWLILAGSVVGCGSAEDTTDFKTGASGCSPGETVTCACPGGGQSTQTCSADGSAFGDCTCSGNGAPPPAGTGGTNGQATGGSANSGTGGFSIPTGGAPASGGAGPVDPPPTGGTDGVPNGGAGGQEPPLPPMPPGDNCLQGVGGDFMAQGPYAVTQEDVTLDGTLGPYTIFRPQTLEASCPHPIVAWGNGTTVTGSAVYSHFHRHAASWGIVVIASHNSNAASQPFLEGGIDYLLAQNQASGSPYFGKLSTRAGTAGHSQGGIAATTAARHPNVQAEVCVQGGGSPPANVAFLCETGVEDFVRGPCTSAYQAAAGPSFLADHQEADHIATPTPLGANTPAGKEYVRLYTAWFRCFLADDEGACSLFRGSSSAPVCSQSNWATCEGKNF